VIDTGDSHSCLSKKSVKNLTEKTTVKADIVVGIGRGRLRNKLVNVPSFKIGDLEIHNYPFLILPLAHINKMLSSIGMETIDGFLGSDILYAYKAKINYDSRIIQLQNIGNE
jgi:predicted aspartyl protease